MASTLGLVRIGAAGFIDWLDLYCVSLLVSGPLLGNALEGLQSPMEINTSLER
jgi:hypothetical protein